MTVAIIDYGSGNLNSAAKALERAARESGTLDRVLVTSSPDEVARADRILLPGVGAFADCRRGLDVIPGMVDAMTESAIEKGRPFLGICVGMQLLATRGVEHGPSAGLDWVSGHVEAVEPSDPSLKIPHMGWNTLHEHREHPLTEGIPLGPEGLHAYFVHSYALRPKNPEDIVATSSYGGPVTAIVAHDNIAGTQFHPEKSQALGLRLLGNFLRWRP